MEERYNVYTGLELERMVRAAYEADDFQRQTNAPPWDEANEPVRNHWRSIVWASLTALEVYRAEKETGGVHSKTA